MRLYFFNRYYWPDESATSQLLTDLAEALAASGNYQVSVVTSRQRLTDAQSNLSTRETRNGVEIHRLWTSRFGRHRLAGRALDYLTFYASAALHVLVRTRRHDIVIAKTDPPLLGAVLAPFVRLKRARLVNWWQDVYPEVAVRLGVLRESGAIARILQAARNHALRRAQVNVVIGERMREHLLAAVPGAKLSVIPNWSGDLRHTPAPAPDNAYRRQLNLAGKVVFAYSGNLGRAHPFGGLLTAAAALREHSELHFLILGIGAQWQSLRDEVQRRGLSNWSFLPPQPRPALADSLGAADVHLVGLDPALEGLIVPSKIYGILAAGRPTLFLGDTRGEVATLLTRHDCGLSAHPQDPAALERAITQLAADADLRRRLGLNARRAFETHHGVGQAVAQWVRTLSGD